jgi:hypothetical protein
VEGQLRSTALSTDDEAAGTPNSLAQARLRLPMKRRQDPGERASVAQELGAAWWLTGVTCTAGAALLTAGLWIGREQYRPDYVAACISLAPKPAANGKPP